MDNIRDPDLKQMVDDFKQQSATIAAYHTLALRRAMFDRVYGSHWKGDTPRLVESQAEPLTVVKRCRGLLVKASQWVIRELGEQKDQVPLVSAAAPPDQNAVVVDASYTVVEDQQTPPAPKETNEWDN